MHGDTVLGGPVWLFAQVVIFGTLALSMFVLVDSLMPRRRAKMGDRLREPLWAYSAVNVAYLLLLLGVQLIPGMQMAAAAVAIASPIVLVFGIAYLLRVVFPKPDAGHGTLGVIEAGPSPSADITDEVETQ